jgi:hypothetical protein
MTKNYPLKMWQNTEFCEKKHDATLQRAIDYAKPTLQLEQGADGLPGWDGHRVIFSRKPLT